MKRLPVLCRLDKLFHLETRSKAFTIGVTTDNQFPSHDTLCSCPRGCQWQNLRNPTKVTFADLMQYLDNHYDLLNHTQSFTSTQRNLDPSAPTNKKQDVSITRIWSSPLLHAMRRRRPCDKFIHGTHASVNPV